MTITCSRSSSLQKCNRSLVSLVMRWSSYSCHDFETPQRSRVHRSTVHFSLHHKNRVFQFYAKSRPVTFVFLGRSPDLPAANNSYFMWHGKEHFSELKLINCYSESWMRCHALVTLLSLKKLWIHSRHVRKRLRCNANSESLYKVNTQNFLCKMEIESNLGIKMTSPLTIH